MKTNDISFRAKFVYERGDYYKKISPQKNKQISSKIDDFLDFMSSERGRKFLEKQPEKDIFELRIYKNEDNTITPKLWHKVYLGNGQYGKVEEDLNIAK